MDHYTHPDIDHQWSNLQTLRYWWAIEHAVASVQGAQGWIPGWAANAIFAADPPTLATVGGWVHETYRTGHDVAAMVNLMRKEVNEAAPGAGEYVHFGLTSSDVVDTAHAIRLRNIRSVLQDGAYQVQNALVARADEHLATYRLGRTHGQAADPTTLGLQLNRLIGMFERAHHGWADPPMKLSGPVGTYAYSPKSIEAGVAAIFGLVPCEAGQCVPRDYYARWAWHCVQLANACEAVATEVRLGSQTGIDEISEPFGREQVGSSAMPHKRNPIRSERLCGLARVARGLFLPLMETAGGLWGERDISNSSVERTALRELTTLVGWMLGETADLVQGLVFDAQRMATNLDSDLSLPTPAAQLFLTVKAGYPREIVYEGYRAHPQGLGWSGGTGEAEWGAASEPAWYTRNHPALADLSKDNVR